MQDETWALLNFFQFFHLLRIQLLADLEIHLRGGLQERSTRQIHSIDGGNGLFLAGFGILADCLQFRLHFKKVLIPSQNFRFVCIKDGVHPFLLFAAEADGLDGRLIVPPATDWTKTNAWLGRLACSRARGC